MKLSIITINYNNATGLSKTLHSVFNQTSSEFEYIVIDGGSTDGSVRLLEQFTSEITLWISESDNGIYHAMNKGIIAATGEYLLFLNSGDCISNDHVIADLIRSTKDDKSPDLIYGNLERIFPNGNRDIVKMPEFITVEKLLKETLCHPVTLIKRDLFKQYGLYDERLKIVADWAFFLKVIILGNTTYKYIDMNVSVFSMDGISSKLSNAPLIHKEREWVINNYLSSTLRYFYLEKQKLEYYNNKYRIEKINSVLKNIKSTINFIASPALELISNLKSRITYSFSTILTKYKIEKYKKLYAYSCFDVPIIINNRNHLTYLKRLITSLEKRGYYNLYIIDNNSDYIPLLEYYQTLDYKIHYLDENVGYCALWDTPIFEHFRDQYYVYTDSDVEIVENCPNDFIAVMHYLLNKYKSVDKVGLSLLINDLPDHYLYKSEVINWESKYYELQIEDIAFKAPVDTTFALYRPNSYGGSGKLSALRTNYPYSARHLPWYENSACLSTEQQYYYKNSSTSTHWSTKFALKKNVQNGISNNSKL
jgi:glycosyltransferase involved in cell wall biosynthesis